MSGSTPADDDYGEDLLYNMACKCEELFDTPISGAVADKWQELQQRFAIWTSYLGVFARKSQCLDTRLQNAPDIKDLVARLLDVLFCSLNDVIKSYSLLQQSQDNSAKSPRNSLEQCQISGLANADSALTRINRLGIDIKRASRGSIDTKVSRFASRVDLAPFITIAQFAVSSFYPGAHELLKEHLRETMAEVYSRILYLRDRQEQLQARRIPQSAFQSGLQPISEDQPVESLSGSNMNPQVSIPADESIRRPTGIVDTARSQVSASRSRPSTLDTQQMLSRKFIILRDKVSTSHKPVSSIQIKQADYPKLQVSDKEKSLKCQWCSKHFEKNETSDSDWRRHVDEDLKPYKCMAERCPDSHPCFTSFDGWFEHMQSHSQRWYQKFFPSPGWVCVVCDTGDVYTNPKSLHSHIEKFHTGQFSESQLQSVLRQSIMERPRPLNECLLCCYTVDEEPGTNMGRSKLPKRQKEQIREESSKMARMTLEMKYPNPHTSASQILDTSSSDSDASSVHREGKTCNGDHAKAIARHIAAHLQMLMVLTIRLSSLPDGNFKSDGDEANSYSVDIGDSERLSDPNDAGRLSASTTDAEMADVDMADIVNNTEETPEDHIINAEELIPEADIDLSHIPRQYDELDAKDDTFFQQLIRSGAFKRTGSMDDLNHAVDASNMEVDSTSKNHPDRAMSHTPSASFRPRNQADHPSTLTSMDNLASTYWDQGRWEEAEKLEVQVMETRKTELGADHPDTLTSMDNLASTYWNQGRWEEAEKLEVQVMETRKTKLGADHPDTLTSMDNLALTYWDQGRWEEAEKLEVQVMETRETKLGADHPSTLTSIANLASTYRNQGRWEEAEELELRVMETRETKLGADHPDTLTSMNNLALTYWNQGRWEEAEELNVQAMETRKTKLGADHPDTLTSMNNLALTYKNQGRWEEAEELNVQVMETRKTKFGADYPDTLTSMANLASTYRSQGRWEEAEKLEVQVMETRKTKLGAGHPFTLTSMSNLALTYWNQGRWEEAEKLNVQVMETRKTKLGADHPDTLTSMNNLAFTWKRQGRDSDALALMEECAQARQRLLGAEHPHALSSLAAVARWSSYSSRFTKHPGPGLATLAETVDVMPREHNAPTLGPQGSPGGAGHLQPIVGPGMGRPISPIQPIRMRSTVIDALDGARRRLVSSSVEHSERH